MVLHQDCDNVCGYGCKAVWLAPIAAAERGCTGAIGGEKMTMLKVQAEYKDFKIIDGRVEVTFSVLPEDKYIFIEATKNFKQYCKPIELTVSKLRKKRSLNANDYMWMLCQKIAETLHSTKEEVYKEHIKETGVFETLSVKEDAVEKFKEAWQKNGIGWVAEVVDNSNMQGYKKVFAYYGSSTYDTKQMALFIDNIVQSCKELEIETMRTAEIMAM